MGLNGVEELLNSEPISCSSVVTAPMLTNTRDTKKGGEVVLKWVKTNKKRAATKPRTWVDDATKERKASSAKRPRTDKAGLEKLNE